MNSFMASSPSCHARKCSLTRSCCSGFSYYGLERECQCNPDTLTVYIDEIDLDRLVDGEKNTRFRKDTFASAAINTFIQMGEKNILFFFRGQLWKASRLHCCHRDKGDFSAKMIPVAWRKNADKNWAFSRWGHALWQSVLSPLNMPTG